MKNVVAEKTMFGSIGAVGVAFSNRAFTAQWHIIPGVNGINPYVPQETLWYRGTNLGTVTLAKLKSAKEGKEADLHMVLHPLTLGVSY